MIKLFSDNALRDSPDKPEVFDYFVISGIVINLIVIGYIITYWLFSS